MTAMVNRATTPGAAILGAAVAVLGPHGMLIAAPAQPDPRVASDINAPAATRSPAFFFDAFLDAPDVPPSTSFMDDVRVLELHDAWQMAVEDVGPLERPDPY